MKKLPELRERVICKGLKGTVCGDHTGPGIVSCFNSLIGKAPNLWDTKLITQESPASVILVQSLSRVWLFVTTWTAARQTSLSFTISRSLLKLMSYESVMPSNYLILCHPLLLLPSVFPSIRVFSSKSPLRIRWPKYRSFSFSINPSSINIQGWFPLGLTGVISLLSRELSRVFSSTTVRKH